jgi:hypothetical protein
VLSTAEIVRQRRRPGPKHTSRRPAIVAALKANPDRSYDAIARELQISYAYVRGTASVESRKAEAAELRRKKPHRERRVPKTMLDLIS